MNRSTAPKLLLSVLLGVTLLIPAVSAQAQNKKTSGNPLLKVGMPTRKPKYSINNTGCIPTYSAKYNEQVFMDAFSSPDLVHWTKHPAYY
jgi:hypothetical protein